MSIRVILVDDNNLFRLGLSALIAAHDGFTVLAHFGKGKDAVSASLNVSPDVQFVRPGNRAIANDAFIYCLRVNMTL